VDEEHDVTWLWLVGLGWAGVPQCQALNREARVAERTERVGTLRNAAWIALRAWQVLISPSYGERCTMSPSCSAYAIRAARRNGPLVGAWMATARIQRMHADDSYPLCASGERLYRYNPPTEDEWWKHEH
jgi:putative component of membrane protein insertase Oxa1/YidC/SpoIIIJ protein YidD